MTWTYRGEPILSHDDLPENCTDFVYELVFSDGTKYLGKKTIRSMRRIKPTKAQLAIRKNYKRIELKNSSFIDYEGSSSENEDKTLVSKEILYLSSNKKSASYMETALLFENNVLFDDTYNNKNISGTYYDNSLEGLIE